MSALPDTLNLAAAGGLDLARAADIASNVMSGFNLMGGDVAAEMSRVSDVLSAAASSSNTDINQLGDAMSYAAPVASAYGISLEESAGAIAIFSNAGIQGSRAGMTLKNSISQLANPVGATAKKLQELGLSAADVNPEVNSMADIIEKLEGAGAKATDAISLVGAEAGPGFAAMLAVGSKGLRQYTKDFENAEGTASRMAADLTDNLGGDIKALGSMWEAFKLQLFFSQEGFLRGVTQGLTKFLGVVVDALPTVFKFVSVFKPAFIGIAVAVGALGAAIGTVVAFKIAMMGLALVASPLGLTVAALVALGAVAGMIVNKFVPLKDVFRDVSDNIKMFFDIVSGNFSMPSPDSEGYERFMQVFERVNPVAERFAVAMSNLKTTLSPIAKAARDVGNAISDMGGMITNPIATLTRILAESPEKARPLFVFKAAFDTFKEAVSGAIDMVKGKWSEFVALFEGKSIGMADAWGIAVALVTEGFNLMTDVINAVSPIIEGALDVIIELFSGLMDLGESIGETMSGSFEAIGTAWDLVVDIISRGAEIVGEVLSTLSVFISPIMKIIGLAFDIVAFAAKWLFFNIIAPGAELAMTSIETAWSIVGPLLELFATVLDGVADAAIWLWENALEPLIDFLGGAFKVGVEASTTIVKGIGKAFDVVGGAVSKVTDKVKTFIDWIKKIEIPSFDFNMPSFGGMFGGKGKGHYHGIDSVPYDGYQATLHRGERVQTAQEVRAEKNDKSSGGGVVIHNINLNSSATNARQLYNEFVDILSKELATEVEFA